MIKGAMKGLGIDNMSWNQLLWWLPSPGPPRNARINSPKLAALLKPVPVSMNTVDSFGWPEISDRIVAFSCRGEYYWLKRLRKSGSHEKVSRAPWCDYWPSYRLRRPVVSQFNVRQAFSWVMLINKLKSLSAWISQYSLDKWTILKASISRSFQLMMFSHGRTIHRWHSRITRPRAGRNCANSSPRIRLHG